jgi:hypothetical protein
MICAALLAGCGGGGGDSPGSGVDPRLARLDIYESQKLRVLGDPGAGVVGLAPTAPDPPAQGTATFAGFATLRVEGAQGVVLFGDAVAEVDFASLALTGGMDRFFGTTPAGAVVDYDGSLALTGSATALDYAGVLTASGQRLVFGGTLAGSFLGNPLRALTALDLEALVQQNGQLRNGTVLIVLETAGVQVP